MQTKFMDTKSSESYVYTTNYLYHFGKFKNYSLLEIQNGVEANTVGICRDQQNFSKYAYMYEYYAKRGFSITLIVLNTYR